MLMSPEDEREIFSRLVEAQDAGRSVTDSRDYVAGAHAISVEAIVSIERRGISEKWPPLDVTFPTPEFDEPAE